MSVELPIAGEIEEGDLPSTNPQMSTELHTFRLIRRVLASRLAGHLALLLFPLGCVLAALAIGQDDNYDLLNYHYYIGYAFLNSRYSIDFFAADLQTLLNPILDVPSYLLMAHAPPRLEAATVATVQGFDPVIVYLIAKRVIGSKWAALAVAVAAAVAGGFASELGNVMGDSIVALPLLLGVLSAVIAILASRQLVDEGELAGAAASRRSPSNRREISFWILAGLFAGLGAGLKFAELPVDVGIVVGAAFVLGSWRVRLRRVLACVLGNVIGVFVTAGYWSIFLWQHYKDPIAFTQSSFGIFHSPYVPSAGSVQGNVYGPHSFVQGLWYPVYWFFHPTAVGEIPIRELSIPLAYALLVVLLIAVLIRLILVLPRAVASGQTAAQISNRLIRSRDLDAKGRIDTSIDRYLIVAFVVTLVIWIKVFDVYRYLIPLELLAPLVLFAVARRLIALVRATELHRRLIQHALIPMLVAAYIACIVTESPANYWLRTSFGDSKYFSLATPSILKNGRPNALVQVGGVPMSFIYPMLPRSVVAIGRMGGLLDPANRRLLRAAFARVHRGGGDIDTVFIGADPGNQSNYLAFLGVPGLLLQRCDNELIYIGAGYDPITFCQYGPAPARTGL